MSRAIASKTIGKWRIVEADLWDADYLDMLEPAFITFKKDGHGEFRFGCVNAGLDCEYSQTTVHFAWQGFDEMDEVCGDGFAEIFDDGPSAPKSPSTLATRPPSKPKSGSFSAAC